MARNTTAASGGRAKAESLAQAFLQPRKRGAYDAPLTKADLLDALGALTAALKQHEDKMEMMELTIKRIAQVDMLGTRVENGLCEIAERLKPLERLQEPREPKALELEDKENLDGIIKSLDRPSWSNATSIPVPNDPVPFVGQTPTNQGSSKP